MAAPATIPGDRSGAVSALRDAHAATSARTIPAARDFGPAPRQRPDAPGPQNGWRRNVGSGTVEARRHGGGFDSAVSSRSRRRVPRATLRPRPGPSRSTRRRRVSPRRSGPGPPRRASGFAGSEPGRARRHPRGRDGHRPRPGCRRRRPARRQGRPDAGPAAKPQDDDQRLARPVGGAPSSARAQNRPRNQRVGRCRPEVWRPAFDQPIGAWDELASRCRSRIIEVEDRRHVAPIATAT